MNFLSDRIEGRLKKRFHTALYFPSWLAAKFFTVEAGRYCGRVYYFSKFPFLSFHFTIPKVTIFTIYNQWVIFLKWV